MEKYYTVFDGRPNEQHYGADLRVGIGMVNLHYDPNLQKGDSDTPEEEKIIKDDKVKQQISGVPTPTRIPKRPENK